MLARLLDERVAQQRAPRLWCCAASTGEEPYSIAMTLADALGANAAPASIVATDIDTAVLAAARAGVYRADAIDKLDRSLVRRWFERGRNANAGLVRVRAELRALIRWQPLNLVHEHWDTIDGERFDAIFCRNVMIYFDKPTQARVLARLAARLKPDGLLFAGHSESLAQARALFEPLGQTVYRRAHAEMGRRCRPVRRIAPSVVA